MLFRRFGSSFVVLLTLLSPLSAQVMPSAFPVVTNRYDNLRSGANLQEKTLLPDRLSPDANGKIQFGKLFSRAVDGAVYAQPLFLPEVTVPGRGQHNIIYIATANNTVYAFDADSCFGENATPLWQRNLGQAIPSSRYNVLATIPLGYALRTSLRFPLPDTLNTALDRVYLPFIAEYRDFSPQIGITGTPVIDRENGLLYVVAATRLSLPDRDVYRHKLFALDVATGQVRKGPVTIDGSVAGNGDSSIDGRVTFDSTCQLQQAALLCDHNNLYVAFGLPGDLPRLKDKGGDGENRFRLNNYGVVERYRNLSQGHGWLFSYDARTLTRTGIFCTTPNATTTAPRIEDLNSLRLANPVGGGITMGGLGPAANELGDVFLLSGRGAFTYLDPVSGKEEKNTADYGTSFLHLTPGQTVSGQIKEFVVTDFFTPSEQRRISQTDNSFGSGGAILFPSPPDNASGKPAAILTGTGESLFLLSTDKLGGYVPLTNPNARVLPGSEFISMGYRPSSTPVYWFSPAKPMMLYHLDGANRLQIWTLQATQSILLAEAPQNSFMVTGAGLTLSANGGNRATGILWAALAGVNTLQAFAATPVTDPAGKMGHVAPVWSSAGEETGADAPGHLSPFVAPVVVGGKVYVPTDEGEITVYSILHDRRIMPITAVASLDALHPSRTSYREDTLTLQGDDDAIDQSALMRVIVPDFEGGIAPDSALLRLHMRPESFQKRKQGPYLHPRNIFITGIDGAGIWQPKQLSWNSAPGLNRTSRRSRTLPLPGAIHSLPMLAQPGITGSDITLDVTDWVRSRSGQSVTFLLWTDSPVPVTFIGKGSAAPELILNWH